jgi:glycosyltransferase involved in cell wall biosynthesis
VNKSDFELSAVIPVTKMAGKLDCFRKTVETARSHQIFLVVVHDWRDQGTEDELLSILSTLDEGSFRFISGTYGSPGESRNRGIKEVSSRWVTFWDSDDSPNVCNIAKALEESSKKYEVLIGNFSTNNHNTNERVEYSLGTDWRNSVSRNPGLWRMIFQRNSIDKLRFTNLLMAEDQLFLVQYRLFDRTVLVCNSVFYDYQISQIGQATSSKRALEDLSRSVELTYGELSDFSSEFEINYQTLFVKQALTGLKKLKVSKKVKVLWCLLKFLCTLSLNQVIQIIKRILGRNGK